jgi:hypothetical protein
MTGPSRRWRHAPLILGAIFAVALWAPIPAAPNTARAQVMAQVEKRFPGWQITRAHSSWEGAWAVVVNCGRLQIGFQLIPGHGLPAGDVWLHPEDPDARTRLATISDDRTWLVWYSDSVRARSLSCRTELARSKAAPRKYVAD